MSRSEVIRREDALFIADGPPMLAGRDFAAGNRCHPSDGFCWVCEQFVFQVRLNPACGPHCLPKDTE
ncbi:hypothetical protein [Rhodococcus sp. BE178]|uniref:hypothetical protein n=1 Tax=Rhodococcus sp. BE178 TaxID=2817737 RepID=UPI003D1B697E